MVSDLESLLARIRGCGICTDLPLGPRPVLQAEESAKIMVIGQAPGTKVHATGIPWNDPSGDRLRKWMAVDRDTFYDDGRIAIMPMGFCYPGRDERGGDRPPRPECAPLWHPPLRARLPAVALTLLVGLYAQRYYLAKARKESLTATVRHWRAFGPALLPLPHPGWRNTAWLTKNPWFEQNLLPDLRARVLKLFAL